MDRRQFVGMLGLGTVAAAMRRSGARAQEASPAASPAAGAGIPPVRWELVKIAGERRAQTPDHPELYWVQFRPDGKLALQADCNAGGGTYELSGSMLTFSPLVSTKVACGEGSLGDRFLDLLGHVASFAITGDARDHLILNLAADGGQLQFAPSLRGVTWQWLELTAADGTTVRAADPSRYTLVFPDDGGVRVKADCNRGRGKAEIDGAEIALTVATTKAMCPPDTQEGTFLDAVNAAKTFAIVDGMLRLTLSKKGGVATFQPVVAP